MIFTCSTTLNISKLQDQSNFSSSELIDYSHKFIDLDCLEKLMNTKIKAIGLVVSGFVGFVSYFFMFATLRRISISGCTLIYYKAIALMEFPHMIVMTMFGVQFLLELDAPQNWFWIFW